MNLTNILFAIPEQDRRLSDLITQDLTPLIITTVHSYAESLDHLKSCSTDLFVLDEALLEDTREFSFAADYRIPHSIVILCSHKRGQYWEGFIPDRIAEYYEKPVNPGQLLRHIKRHIMGGLSNTLFKNLNDAAFIADLETGIITDVNSMGEKLLGRGRSDIIGMHHTQFYPEPLQGKALEIFDVHTTKKVHTPLGIDILQESGNLISVEISGSHIFLGGRKHILGVFHDISDRKKIGKPSRNPHTGIRLFLMLCLMVVKCWIVMALFRKSAVAAVNY